MAAPTVYKSTDASAPTLNGQAGSLITVLKACLVTGYGSKTGAGWTVDLEDAPNHKIIFRNDSVSGSGRYFRIQDNGYVYSGQATAETSTACLVGMHAYSNIDSPTQPFPRVINGGTDPHSSTAYGVTIRKRYSSNTNAAYAAPWIIVADNRTCYLITTAASANSTALPASSSTTKRGITAFGDQKSIAPGNSGLPKAFVSGGMFGALSNWLDQYGDPTYDYYNLGMLGKSDNRTYRYVSALDASMEVASAGVGALIKPTLFGEMNEATNTMVIGGTPANSPAVGTYMRYPSPFTFDICLNPLVIGEDSNDAIRTYKYVPYTGGPDGFETGYLPGIYGLMNTTATNCAYRIGDDWSVHTDTAHSNKQYLLGSLNWANNAANESYARCIAFDLQDWWA